MPLPFSHLQQTHWKKSFILASLWMALGGSSAKLVSAAPQRIAQQTPAAIAQAPSQDEQLDQQAIELYQQGRYQEAEELYLRSLAIRQAQFGPNHVNTAVSLNNLAELYRAMGRYGEAEPLYVQALTIRKEQLGPGHGLTGQSLNNLALLYRLQGRYEEAEPLFLQALTISEQQFGPTHPNTGASLGSLAELYRLQGRYEEAEPLSMRSLAISEQQFGPDQPGTATSLNNLALLYESMGRYEDAESLYIRSLKIYESRLGPEHPLTATGLNNLASLYFGQGRYAEVEPLYVRSLAIYESQFGPDHPNVATTLNNLALLYDLMGRYEAAELSYVRSLAIYEARLGPEHSLTAQSLTNLAALYRKLGRYEEAETLVDRGLAAHESKLGPEHPLTAQSLTSLAALYRDMGRYNDAEPLIVRVLAIHESQLGPEHPDTATSLNNLASLYHSMGRFDDAEPLHIRALAIRESQLGPEHLATANSLTNLAELYRSLGRYEEAASLMFRSLTIREKQLGRNHPETAQSLNNLAGLYESLNSYEQAEDSYLQALAIYELQFGPNHPETATSLNNLAGLYESLNRYDKAEQFYLRALDIYKLQFGPEHLATANSLNNLAALYVSMNRYVEAEPLLLKSLGIREQQLGSEHPLTSVSFSNLAGLYWAQGQLQTALDYLNRGITAEESALSRNLVLGSDAEKRNYLKTVSGTTDWAITFSLNALPDSSDASYLGLSTVIQRKGRILDLFTNLRGQLANDSAAIALFDELTAVGTQFSTLRFNPPPGLQLEAYQAKLQALQKRITDLEDELSRRSIEFANLKTSPSLTDIEAALTPETALVEFSRYSPFDLKAELSERFGEERYAAYILKSDGTIEGIDLGPAKPIDMAIGTLNNSLASPGTPIFQVKEEAQELDSLVMAPVRQFLANTTTVFLSPDGALNLIPFETLVDENNNYLVERYQFRYLTSGRDLMRITNTPVSKNPAVLMGGPTFSTADDTIREPVEVARRAINFENNIFPSLEGTEIEIQEIAKRLNVEPYLRTTATEAQLKAIDSPRILHVATHGFFKPIDDDTSNPLLQSGLVLAGVKERQSGPEQDGILTALEVTGMDLQGTQLAVLSACETGLGELTAGEGIYGLRRALVLAGTQSQVISLWKVDDTATQELMVNYYDRLLAGAPRDAALRETQLAFLDHEEYSHPYYWSAFIGSGNWQPLQF